MPIVINQRVRKSKRGEYIDIIIPLNEYHIAHSYTADRRRMGMDEYPNSTTYTLTIYKQNPRKPIPVSGKLRVPKPTMDRNKVRRKLSRLKLK